MFDAAGRRIVEHHESHVAASTAARLMRALDLEGVKFREHGRTEVEAIGNQAIEAL